MCKLDELINELCPDGVEYKSLQEIFNIKNGYTPLKRKKEYWENGTIPWFRMEDIRTSGGILTDSIQHITKLGVKGSLFPKNSIIIATTATIGVHALIKKESLANQQFTYLSIRENYLNSLNIMYIYYYCFKLDKWCIDNTRLGSFPTINMNDFKKYRIPIPPLPIQEEIVRILDTFTELTAELTVELTARKKQYEYYRDKLLTFDDSVEWKELGEVGTFIRGKRFVKKDIKENGFPCIHYGELYTCYKNKIAINETKSFLEKTQAIKLRTAKKSDVIIISAGETVEDLGFGIAWLGDENVVTHDACFTFSHNQNPKFISYCLQTDNYHKQINRYVSTGKISSVSKIGLSRAKIPVPPLAEQERIVKILDKFDTLTNDISKGLPAEIEARQKQYEYYRDKLLTFKEKKA